MTTHRARFDAAVRTDCVWHTDCTQHAESVRVQARLIEQAHEDAHAERLARMTDDELAAEARETSRAVTIAHGWLTTDDIDQAHAVALVENDYPVWREITAEREAFAAAHGADALAYATARAAAL